jgi:hypothetical protein
MRHDLGNTIDLHASENHRSSSFWWEHLFRRGRTQFYGTASRSHFDRSTWARPREVESSWNVMAHDDAREGKWRGNWRIEWVASTLHTTSEHGVSSITTVDAHTSTASCRLNWRPFFLNGLARFAERRNLVSARVPSHFKRSLIEGYWVSWLQIVIKRLSFCVARY